LVLTNRRIVTETIERFKVNYGNVKFLINHNPTDKKEIYDLITSDEETGYKGYSKTLLITERILLATKKENNITKINGSYLNTLKPQSFITMPKGSRLFRHTNRICSSEGFAADIAIECDDPFYLRKYVELGLGIAFIPEFSWQGMFSDEVTLVDIGNYRRNTFVFHNHESYQTKTVKIFLETLLKYCKRHGE
jgi:DNA-binding transcriptional LysR family regulator